MKKIMFLLALTPTAAWSIIGGGTTGGNKELGESCTTNSECFSGICPVPAQMPCKTVALWEYQPVLNQQLYMKAAPPSKQMHIYCQLFLAQRD